MSMPEAQSTRMFISPKATPPKERYESLRISGVQQVPPVTVVNGLAIIFTVFIMGPVVCSAMTLPRGIRCAPALLRWKHWSCAGRFAAAAKFLEANTDLPSRKSF